MRPFTVFVLTLALDPVVALAKKDADPPKIVMPEAFADGMAQTKSLAWAQTIIMDVSSDAPRPRVSPYLHAAQLADAEAARKKVAANQKGMRELLVAFHQPRAADKEGAAAMTGEPLAKKIAVKIAPSRSESVPVVVKHAAGQAPVLETLAPRLKTERPITFQRKPTRPILHLHRVH